MARSSNSPYNESLLEAALEGLRNQRSRIDEQIAEVERMLGRRGRVASTVPHTVGAPGKKRQLSPAARKRIAAAQKKRWAEYRRNSSAGKPA
jgi:hypothetical protein